MATLPPGPGNRKLGETFQLLGNEVQPHVLAPRGQSLPLVSSGRDKNYGTLESQLEEEQRRTCLLPMPQGCGLRLRNEQIRGQEGVPRDPSVLQFCQHRGSWTERPTHSHAGGLGPKAPSSLL